MNYEILVKINKIFQIYFDDESLEVSAGTTANDIEEWDSLAQIGLVLSMEKEFNLRFVPADIERLKNIGEMVVLIETKSS
jgi:acyl carrier protein